MVAHEVEVQDLSSIESKYIPDLYKSAQQNGPADKEIQTS